MRYLFAWFWHGEDVSRRLATAIGTAAVYVATTQPRDGDWGLYQWVAGLAAVIFGGSLSKPSNGSGSGSGGVSITGLAPRSVGGKE